MQISKKFSFSYGHRVYNQELDSNLSCNGLCKCRHLHGHNGVVSVVIESKNYKDVVLDFNNLKLFEKVLDEIFDHKFVVGLKDPYLKTLLTNYNINYENRDDLTLISSGPFYTLKAPQNEYEESFVFMEKCPTSENICEEIYKVFYNLYKPLIETNQIKLSSVTFSETEKTNCVYTKD